MVNKLLRFLHKETSSLHEAAFLLGFFAILSQVLAFLRDRLLAHVFGASSTLDIYYAAFRIPDFIFVTVASVVSLSVLVPFIIERDSEGKESVRDFVDSVFSFFLILMAVAASAAYFLMPWLSALLFRGFSPEALGEVVFVSRILLLSPIALGISNLFGSLTQAYNRFAIYAVAPLLYNVGIIVGIILLGRELGATGVAVGVVFGAILHAAVQLPFVLKAGFLPRRFTLNLAPIKRVATLSLPRTLTLSTNHLAIVFMTSFASLMAAGSISIVSFANNLQSVPLTIVGVSYSLAAFPTLSRYFSQNNITGFIDQMASTARHIIFWALPATALFVILRAQIVRVLLGTGRFDWEATRLVAASLAVFVVSAVFQSLSVLFTRAFYSAGHTKKPFFISLFSTAVLIGSTYGLMHIFYNVESFRYFMTALLRVGDLGGTEVLMLPLGFTLGMALNGIMQWIVFEHEFRGFSRRLWRTVFESFGSAVIMGTAAYIGLAVFGPVFDTSTLLGIFLQGLAAGLLSIGAGVAVLYSLGSKELKETWKAIHAKFWRAKVISEDAEIV